MYDVMKRHQSCLGGLMGGCPSLDIVSSNRRVGPSFIANFSNR